MNTPIPSWAPNTPRLDLLPTERGVINRPLFHAIADWMDANPEHFDMEVFSCGTSACIGGTAVLLLNTNLWWNEGAVSVIAQRLLGLSDGQADMLFFGANHSFWFNTAVKYGWISQIEADDYPGGTFKLMNRHPKQLAELLRKIGDGIVVLPEDEYEDEFEDEYDPEHEDSLFNSTIQRIKGLESK